MSVIERLECNVVLNDFLVIRQCLSVALFVLKCALCFIDRLFSPFELIVANGLWFNSHLGVGLFIFSRKHIEIASVPYRVLYSALGSVIFNFGSVLLWATGKAVLPSHPPTRVAFGALSGLAFLSLGYSYFRFVDALCLRCLPFNGRVVDNLGEEVD